MARLDAIDRVADAYGDPEVTVSHQVDPEAAVERIIADPTTATAEDWQAAQEAYPEAFEDEGGR
jgi:hypothetical protein